VSESTSCYPSLSVDTMGTGIVSQAGAVMLLRTAEKTGLGGCPLGGVGAVAQTVGQA